MIKIDARGLSCPEPLTLLAGSINSKEKEYQIIVDSQSAKENIIRYCTAKNYNFSLEEDNSDIFMNISL